MTNTDCLRQDAQQEFNYPQGESNNLASYEGNGALSWRALRRILIAFDARPGKLPFSDDVNAQSRLLMRRTVRERVAALAPFLTSTRTRTSCWATTAGSHGSGCVHAIGYLSVFHALLCRWPIHQLHAQQRQSVVDAYDGTTSFTSSTIRTQFLAAYRAIFPGLFKDASAMPAGLRKHVRYPNCCLSYRLKSTASITMTIPKSSITEDL